MVHLCMNNSQNARVNYAWYHRRTSLWRPWTDPYCPAWFMDEAPQYPPHPKPWRGPPEGLEGLAD
jgi:hypothetical protein